MALFQSSQTKPWRSAFAAGFLLFGCTVAKAASWEQPIFYAPAFYSEATQKLIISVSNSHDTYSNGSLQIMENMVPIRSEPQGFTFRDVKSYQICEEKDPQHRYICLWADMYNFAVPVNIKPDQTEWRKGGYHFKLLERGLSFSFVGRRVSEVMRIATYKDDDPDKQLAATFFSYEIGILAIGLPRDDASEGDFVYFWLMDHEGFGVIKPLPSYAK